MQSEKEYQLSQSRVLASEMHETVDPETSRKRNRFSKEITREKK